jgi:hypothetical protein
MKKKIIKIKLSRKSAEELCDLQEKLDRESKSTFFTEGVSRKERLKKYMEEKECLFG